MDFQLANALYSLFFKIFYPMPLHLLSVPMQLLSFYTPIPLFYISLPSLLQEGKTCYTTEIKAASSVTHLQFPDLAIYTDYASAVLRLTQLETAAHTGHRNETYAVLVVRFCEP